MHPQSFRAMELWAQEPRLGDPDFDVDTRRSLARAVGLAEPKEDVESVADIDAFGVPARLYRPASGAGTLLHLHGGGFVFGDLETHDAHCRRLANRTGRAVLAVDYRRAPEHAYPAARDDVDRAVDWLHAQGADHGLDVTGLAVIGDSAGGHLAAVTVWGQPDVFSKAILVYPCIAPDNAQPSYRARSGGLDAVEMDWYWDSYAPKRMRDQPELRLGEQDLSSFPPTLVVTAEHDPLVDEGETFATRLAAAGVPCVGTRYLGMIHGFYRWPSLFDASEQVQRQVSGFLRGEGPSPQPTGA
jgi:acetyl esterase